MENNLNNDYSMGKRANNRSDMPNARTIFEHWRKKLLNQYSREMYTAGTCFACLREGVVQRCHIKPLALGGSNQASNLHLLCPNCHVESECYIDQFYWEWFKNKDLVFLPLYRNIEQGNLIVRFTELIKKQAPAEYERLVKYGSPKEILKAYNDFTTRAYKIKEQDKNSQAKLF